jgi:hypothetical protein
MGEAEVVDMLRGVVDSPPSSRVAVDELEASLSEAMDLAGVEDFIEALSLYEPTETPGEHLIGFDGLRSSARNALHELGRHDHCLHDVPPDERP